jgi:hypothetical protein
VSLGQDSAWKPFTKRLDRQTALREEIRARKCDAPRQCPQREGGLELRFYPGPVGTDKSP